MKIAAQTSFGQNFLERLIEGSEQLAVFTSSYLSSPALASIGEDNTPSRRTPMERPKTKAFNVAILRPPTGGARQFIVPTNLSSEPAIENFPDVGRKPAAKRFSYST